MSKTVPFQTIQFSISTQFECEYTIYLSKTFLFQAIQFSQTVLIQTIQFSISMQFYSRHIDRALSGATISGQSGPGSNGNEGVFCIPQSSSITGTSPSDCLVSYPGNLLGGLAPLQRSNRCTYSPSRLGNPVLVFWGMRSILSLPLLPGPLSPELIVPDRPVSMDQIELFGI